MATFVKFQAFVEHLAEGVHDLGSDTLTVALCSAANAPSVSADAVLGDLTEIAYTYLSSRVLSTASSSQTGGVYKLVVNDLVISASGGTAAGFRYVIIYNDSPTSPADPLIGYYDYGSDLALADGESLTLDFNATNGLLQLT
jgi:hypothetical protein